MADTAEAKLVEVVEYSLRNFLFPNALFLAERLHANAASEESLALVATCHLQSGRPNKAYSLLKSSRIPLSPGTKYLFATCCFKLGHLKEAEEVLRPTARNPTPNGAAGCHLLAQVYRCVATIQDANLMFHCRRLNQKGQAIEYFRKSLELNPFLWCSYEALCELGVDEDAKAFFGGADVLSTASASLRSQTLPHEQASPLLLNDSTPSQPLR